jgi:Flp pilus assembly protein TadD
MITEELFSTAMNHHQAGRLAEAEKLYRQILAQDPDDADVLQLLGLVVFRQGKMPDALEFLDRAVALDPDAPDYRCNRGMILSVLGRPAEAVVELQRAVELKGDYVEAHYQLAHALGLTGQTDQAIDEYRRALLLRPDFAEAMNDLGVLLATKEDSVGAMAAFRRAVEIRPDYIEALGNLARALHEAKLKTEEIEILRRIIALKPGKDAPFSELTISLAEEGRLDESLVAGRRAVELHPDSAEVYSNLGTTLHRMGRIPEAMQAQARALEIDPESANGHLNMSLLRLLSGDFERGWNEYEWRWRVLKPIIPEPRFSQTMWDGRDIAGRRILLHPEGGYGDTIQFVRYAPLVAARGGQVVLGCPEELFRLMQTLEGVTELAVTGAEIPKFELQCPLLSLPRVLKTKPQNVPANVPYLHADPALAKRCRMTLDGIPARLKVGLVWAGRPEYFNDRNRSIPLARFSGLSKVPGAWFCSLQKGKAGEQMSALPDWKLTDWTRELRDFADTAALISNLDLIISVDTAMAHLAGAMGKRVWVLLPYAPDWRWLMQGDQTPWYPTMRLFRQPIAGDWDTPFAQMENALRQLAEQSA